MTETAAGGSFTGKYISISTAGGGLSTQKLEVNKALIDGAGSNRRIFIIKHNSRW